MTAPAAAAAASPGVRKLLLLSVPALAIGAGSAVVLWLLDLASEWLRGILWEQLPGVVGATGETWWWILLVLTLVGLAVGAVVQFVPGHAGADSATTELSDTPPKLRELPSLGLVVILGLAGGVSLGPENPIMAINAALAVALVARFVTAVPPAVAIMLSASGTIAAMFGTPVAAALLFTGLVGAIKAGGSLWDKLFVPLVAAGAGAVTMRLLGGQSIAFDIEPMGEIQPIYLLTGTLAAVVAAALAIVAAFLFPYIHRAFHALKHPILFTTLGGFVLGLLGVLGGPITMFKGLHETGELLSDPGAFTTGQLAAFAGIKVLALLVAASAGFRGGRIFPIVFVGVALGLLAAAVVPGLPLSLAVACASMGVVLVATRDGWMAMFLGVVLVGDVAVLPLLCVIILPVWLMVTKAPELVVHPRGGAAT